MALRYSLDEAALADHIEQAVQTVLNQGLRTADIMEQGCIELSTDAMGNALVKKLAEAISVV